MWREQGLQGPAHLPLVTSGLIGRKPIAYSQPIPLPKLSNLDRALILKRNTPKIASTALQLLSTPGGRDIIRQGVNRLVRKEPAWYEDLRFMARGRSSSFRPLPPPPPPPPLLMHGTSVRDARNVPKPRALPHEEL